MTPRMYQEEGEKKTKKKKKKWSVIDLKSNNLGICLKCMGYTMIEQHLSYLIGPQIIYTFNSIMYDILPHEISQINWRWIDGVVSKFFLVFFFFFNQWSKII